MKVFTLLDRPNIEELLTLENAYILCSSDRCSMCEALAASLEAFESDKFVYKIVDQEFVHKLGIMNVPCLVHFQNGCEVKRTYGNKTQQYLKYFFEKEANE